MEYPAFLDAIRTESARFRAVLADCHPDALVPACLDWTAADLLWHLTDVQWFWTQVIHTRPAPPDDDLVHPDRPDTYDALLARFDEESAALLAALTEAEPDAEAWHWGPVQTVGASYRRQAHEALIHRLDAEQAAGSVTPLDPALAADGVLEALDVMYGGEMPDDCPFEPASGLLAVELTDTGDTILVEPGEITGGEHAGPHLLVRPSESASGSPRASVRGTAGDVDAWLWHRLPDSVIVTDGDPPVLQAFQAAVSFALD